MILIARHTHKNVTVNIYADKKAERYLNKDGNGNYYPITDDLSEYAMYQANSLYGSYKNPNKRKKISFDITVYSSSRNEIKSMITENQKSFERLYKKVGGVENGGKAKLFTMLNNKGY